MTSVRGSFWRFATLVLAVIVLLTIANTYMNQRRLEEHRVLRENLQSELDSVRIYLDYLAELLKGKPGLSSSDIEYFKERGLLDPVVDIKASLQEKKELIPYEGVMGGTMDFYDIHVLTSRWVLAYVEDGHVGGHMLLEYDVSQTGEISWEFVRAHLD